MGICTAGNERIRKLIREKERSVLYCDQKDRKNADRNIKNARAAAYTEMERDKPRNSAVRAFRHKPYEMRGVHSELGRQSIEKAQRRRTEDGSGKAGKE